MQYIFLSNRIKTLKEQVAKLPESYYFGGKFSIGTFWKLIIMYGFLFGFYISLLDVFIKLWWTVWWVFQFMAQVDIKKIHSR